MNRFEQTLRAQGLTLPPLGINTLQVNITRQCNQACLHCHVDASPKRTEHMEEATLQRCLTILAEMPGIGTLDITGGAPELHPRFGHLVERARALSRRVIVRHNLTVTLEPHPTSGASMEHLPAFFAAQQVEIVASLPCYEQRNTDQQRGRGVFEKSIESLRRLNALGYGSPDAGLVLNLMYNPVGAYLPGDQAALEADYRRILAERHGVSFSRLFALTNMPIRRFRDSLIRLGSHDAYLDKLRQAFNPQAARGVMCRSLLSVSYDGRIFDCDFNQMAELPVLGESGSARTIFDFDLEALAQRAIRFVDHCFGCTAGAGSGCGGQVGSDPQ